MNPIIEQISKIGIVPVITLDDTQDAEPLAQALIRGGLAVQSQQRKRSESWRTNFLTCWWGQERFCL